MTKKPTQLIAYTSILVAFAILIPIIMPLKLIIGPASFTLASHVPLFLAIFMSIPVAILVALGTTLGFLLAGLPLIIVLRALSHLLFAILAAWWLSRKPQLMTSAVKCFSFAFFINVIHGLAEFLVVYILTATTATSMSYARLDWLRFAYSWHIGFLSCFSSMAFFSKKLKTSHHKCLRLK